MNRQIAEKTPPHQPYGAHCPHRALKTYVRLLSLVLCLNLILPLAGQDFIANASVDRFALTQNESGVLSSSELQRLLCFIPASLFAVPSVEADSSRGFRPLPAGFSESLFLAIYAALILFFLRIEPVAWDSGNSLCFLPSARGLIAFAMPPPCRPMPGHPTDPPFRRTPPDLYQADQRILGNGSLPFFSSRHRASAIRMPHPELFFGLKPSRSELCRS